MAQELRRTGQRFVVVVGSGSPDGNDQESRIFFLFFLFCFSFFIFFFPHIFNVKKGKAGQGMNMVGFGTNKEIS